MRPNKMTIYELFERQRRYVVPLFQRPYVWTREEQWAPLWKDIADKAEEWEPNQKARPHFFGAVVLSQRMHFGRELDASDIIDGQQRLTTLQVLFAAFRDLTANVDARLHGELRRLTENSGIKDHEDETLKVWPTNADREVMRAVMTSGSTATLEAKYPKVYKRKKLQPRPPLVEAYAFFRDQLERFATDADREALPVGASSSGGLSVDRLYKIFDAVRHLLQLVVIELEESDDPQVIFETLNARGARLLPSDLVRNFVFLTASRQGGDVDELYRDLWSEYDERRTPGGHGTFWKQEERQGRATRTLLDLFLIHYLSYRHEREVSHTHLFREFREWWLADRERKVVNELEILLAYSREFATFFTNEETTEAARFKRVWIAAGAA